MATASNPFTTPEEYLHSSYHPDCDLVDGEVRERNLGEFEHSYLQMLIGGWFLQHSQEWSIVPLPEMRLRIRADRYRIADLAVVRKDAVREPVLSDPPLLVIELLSPEDRVSRYQERIADYQQMGIEHIWIINPVTREAHDCSSGDWIRKQRLEVAGTPIYLALKELPRI